MSLVDIFNFVFNHDWMPHGHCYSWEADVLWMNVLGDGITALAYFVIPFMLFYTALKATQLYHPIRVLFTLFGLFILLCGISHVFDIITVWFPIYRLAGYERLATGLVSLITALYIFLKRENLQKIKINQYTILDNTTQITEIELPPEKL